MTRIDPSIHKFQTRLHSKFKASPPTLSTGDSAPDTVDITSHDKATGPEPKPKKSFARHLLEKTLMGGMALTTIAGAFTGIGVATNMEVLQEAANQETPISVFDAKKGQSAESTSSAGGSGGGGSSKPTSIDVTPDGPIDLSKARLDMGPHGITARIESNTAQGLINQYRESDLVQTQLGSQLSQAENDINEELSSVKVPSGEALLNARVPFPSAEGSLLQVRGVNIPVGLKKLAMEDIPLVLQYEVDPVNTGLEAKLTQAQVESASLPGGVQKGLHLGAVRAEVHHKEDSRIPVSGRVRVGIDDGAATRRALEKTSDPQERAALNERLQQIERIHNLAGDQNLDSVMDFIAEDREVEFKGHLKGPGGRVADGTVHVWMTPDSDNDQRGDIEMSGELYTASLESMEFEATELRHVESKRMREGGIGGFLQNKIAEHVETAAQQAVPGVMNGIRGLVNGKIQERFQAELNRVEEQADDMFDQTLDAAQKSGAGVDLNLSRLDVDAKTGDLIGQVTSDQDMAPKITIGEPQKAQVGSTAGLVVGPQQLEKQTQKEGELVSVIGESTVAIDYSKPSVVIPGSSARRFLSELIKQPELQEAFQDLTAGPKEQIRERAQNMEGPSGSVKVTAEIPFPSARNIDSPFGQIPELEKKAVPFTASYQLDDFGVDMNLDVQPVEVKEAVRPAGMKDDGVFVGAVRVTTGKTTANVGGELQIEKEDTEGSPEWAEQALDSAFEGQDFSFKSKVSVGETDSLFYLWVVPDTTGDGKADVAVAHRSIKTGAEDLQVEMESVEAKGGESRDQIQSIVGRIVSQQLEKSGDRLSGNVSQMLEQRVKDMLADGTNEMSQEINQHLAQFYSKIGDLDIPVPEGMEVPGGKLGLKLGAVKVQGDAIVSEYGNERTERILTGYQVERDDSQTVAPGELRAHVPGVIFNRLLEDTSNGGPLDWNNILKKASDDSSAIKSLKLAKNDKGETISPHIRVIDGKPTLAIQLDGDTNGIASPVSGAARLLPGFVGDGLGWLTDNTVGAVLGSRLQTEVQVPLDFGVQDGQLKIKTGEVKFASPEDVDLDLVDILPTRLLSGLITDGVASAFGPDAVNEMLQKQNIGADLSQFGLQWTRVDIQGSEGKAPNLTVGVTLGENLPDMIGRKAGEFRRGGR
jgi:hypothetical protein